MAPSPISPLSPIHTKQIFPCFVFFIVYWLYKVLRWVSDQSPDSVRRKTKFGFLFLWWKVLPFYLFLCLEIDLGNLLSWVVLEQTSAEKLRLAAIERENGFCQAPLLAPFHHSTINGGAKQREKITGAVRTSTSKMRVSSEGFFHLEISKGGYCNLILLGYCNFLSLSH